MKMADSNHTFNLGFACGVAFCAGAVGALGFWALVIKKGVSNG